jgi:hypothetical protein
VEGGIALLQLADGDGLLSMDVVAIVVWMEDSVHVVKKCSLVVF